MGMLSIAMLAEELMIPFLDLSIFWWFWWQKQSVWVGLSIYVTVCHGVITDTVTAECQSMDVSNPSHSVALTPSSRYPVEEAKACFVYTTTSSHFQYPLHTFQRQSILKQSVLIAHILHYCVKMFGFHLLCFTSILNTCLHVLIYEVTHTCWEQNSVLSLFCISWIVYICRIKTAVFPLLYKCIIYVRYSGKIDSR